MNKIRNYIKKHSLGATLATASILGLTSCIASNPQKEAPLMENFIADYIQRVQSTSTKNMPLHTLDHLIVNDSWDFRTQVFKSEEQGLKDMGESLKTACSEEAWFYSNGKFIEIGAPSEFVFITHKEVDGSLSFELGYLENTLKGFREFSQELDSNNKVQYHIHPAKYPQAESIIKKLKASQPELNSSDLERIRSFLDKGPSQNSLLKMSAPSSGDIADMIVGSLQDSNLKYRVRSIYGFDEYALTPEGRIYFRSKSEEQIKNHALNLVNLDVNPTSPQDMARKVSDKYVSVKFYPLND